MTKMFVAAIFALTAVAAASTGGASAHSLTSPATVRSGPGIQWPTIAQIPAGAKLVFPVAIPGGKAAGAR